MNVTNTNQAGTNMKTIAEIESAMAQIKADPKIKYEKIKEEFKRLLEIMDKKEWSTTALVLVAARNVVEGVS